MKALKNTSIAFHENLCTVIARREATKQSQQGSQTMSRDCFANARNNNFLMKRYTKIIIFLGILISILMFSTYSQAISEFQTITPDPSKKTILPGEIFTLSAMYDVSDRSNLLTGIGFYVHYDSSLLEFVEVSNEFTSVTTTYVGSGSPEDDIEDYDESPNTDKRFVVAWFSVSCEFPGEDLPLSLMDITFKAKEEIETPADTFINFSAPGGTASCYDFYSTSMEVYIVSFHMSMGMDIDDNGEVGALTDGLLLTRYLFGFTGKDLVDGAIAPDARRTGPAEIALHIENLITAE